MWQNDAGIDGVENADSTIQCPGGKRPVEYQSVEDRIS